MWPIWRKPLGSGGNLVTTWPHTGESRTYFTFSYPGATFTSSFGFFSSFNFFSSFPGLPPFFSSCGPLFSSCGPFFSSCGHFFSPSTYAIGFSVFFPSFLASLPLPSSFGYSAFLSPPFGFGTLSCLHNFNSPYVFTNGSLAAS